MAQRLGWTFIDTDELVVKEAGMSIAELIHLKGEPAFREYEKRAVKQAVSYDKTVIATGGGVPLYEDNMRRFEHSSEVIWIKVTPETVLKRMGDVKARPLIDATHPLESIQKRLLEREPFYSKAHHVVDSDAMTPSDMVEKILALLPAQPT